MPYQRKTIDTWQFWVDYGYGYGFELENTETNYKAFRENLKAYRQNLPGSARLKIKRKRERIRNAKTDF